MHPSSILSYYPTYSVLDEVVSHSDYKTLHLYVDLKNCLQSLYMEHAITNIIEQSQKSNFTDTSIFTSVLSFLSFHRLYALKRQMNLKVFMFFETGKSYYHLNISKKYKISRRIDDLYGLDREKRDLFFQVVHKNLMLIDKACNKMPNVNVIRLPNFEADFVPYYLISRNVVDTSDDVVHLVYSNDHDLMQTVTAGNHVYIYQKYQKRKRIVRKNQVMKNELKTESDICDTFQPLAMSVIGDGGDDVDGIKGVGGKTFLKLFEELKDMVGDVPTLYENVMSGSPIFDLSKCHSPNKHLNTIIEKEEKENFISNNLKLVCFELISRHLDDPSNTEIIKKKNIILDVIGDTNIAAYESLKKGLEMNGVFIPGEELEVIYYGYNSSEE